MPIVTIKKKPICENAVLLVIRKIGYEWLESVHKFKYELITIMNEHEFPTYALEAQPENANSASMRKIYNHAQYLDKNIEMMQ